MSRKHYIDEQAEDQCVTVYPLQTDEVLDALMTLQGQFSPEEFFQGSTSFIKNVALALSQVSPRVVEEALERCTPSTGDIT